MSNDGNFDLSGVFHVQKNYLTDLSDSYPDVNSAPLVASYVLNLQDKIKKNALSYNDANTSAENILTEQNKMIDIVETEKARLDKKKLLIDQAEMEERRKVLLTESNQLRKAAYTKVIMVFILCVFIHICLLLITRHLFTPPLEQGVNTLFVLLHIFNFALWTLVAFYIYINIQSRSQINFNKLELPPPHLLHTSSSPANANYNNLFKDLGLCYSDGCCGDNTSWDDKIGTCVSDDSINTITNSSNAPGNAPDTEGFSSLISSPKFKTEKITEPIDKEKSFDPNTASDEDIKKNAKLQVSKTFNEVLGPMKQSIASSLETNTEETNKKIDSDMEEMNNMGDDIMKDSLVEDAPIKCNFTTMEQSNDCGCNKSNRMVFQPSETNSLLPKTDVLDNDVYYTGLNSSKELTNRFSNYN
jgi:hypothetical protein